MDSTPIKAPPQTAILRWRKNALLPIAYELIGCPSFTRLLPEKTIVRVKGTGAGPSLFYDTIRRRSSGAKFVLRPSSTSSDGQISPQVHCYLTGLLLAIIYPDGRLKVLHKLEVDHIIPYSLARRPDGHPIVNRNTPENLGFTTSSLNAGKGPWPVSILFSVALLMTTPISRLASLRILDIIKAILRFWPLPRDKTNSRRFASAWLKAVEIQRQVMELFDIRFAQKIPTVSTIFRAEDNVDIRVTALTIGRSRSSKDPSYPALCPRQWAIEHQGLLRRCTASFQRACLDRYGVCYEETLDHVISWDGTREIQAHQQVEALLSWRGVSSGHFEKGLKLYFGMLHMHATVHLKGRKGQEDVWFSDISSPGMYFIYQRSMVTMQRVNPLQLSVSRIDHTDAYHSSGFPDVPFFPLKWVDNWEGLDVSWIGSRWRRQACNIQPNTLTVNLMRLDGNAQQAEQDLESSRKALKGLVSDQNRWLTLENIDRSHQGKLDKFVRLLHIEQPPFLRPAQSVVD
ncbi:hypothetical protein NliqN6_2760 [Naganishia liquefaciens]|uniref:Uncharacterized protein n=1 Tax=Naganishia liquefaciens TaxID=104408 RepID=A0A8H3TT11_9TREE|nr:hypothetical protein NliqN6_2760 [Naganishia liquefaciens]